MNYRTGKILVWEIRPSLTTSEEGPKTFPESGISISIRFWKRKVHFLTNGNESGIPEQRF